MLRQRSAVAWTLLACACERDDAARYELDGLTVIQDFDEPICVGSFPYFERRLRWLEQETGLPRDPQGLSYRWLFDRAAVEAACNLSLGGCTKGRAIFGDLIVFSHELVHAHLSRLGRPRPWLVEGMATMLEDELNDAPQPLFTPSVMVEIDDGRDVDYDAAGAFTDYLRERYGMALLLDYYEASAGTDAAASIEVFADVFGDPFADAEAEYLAGGLPATSGSLECDGPDVSWDGATWEHTFRLSCDEPGSIGPQRSEDDAGSYLWSKVTMTAPAGWTSLQLGASGPTWISVIACEGTDAVYVATDEPQADVFLAGGRYVVFADAFIADAPIARVTARSLPGAPDSPKQGPPAGLLHRGAARGACSASDPQLAAW
jgi:hypothetical protein